jgi:hypothetical protein
VGGHATGIIGHPLAANGEDRGLDPLIVGGND